MTGSALFLLLSVVEPLWVAAVVTWLLLERRSPAATLAWILALVWLPVIGVPVYILLGPRRLRRRKLRALRAKALAGRDLAEWEEAAQGQPLAMVQLMRLATRLDGLPPQCAAEVELLDDGDRAIEAVLAALDGARRHAHLESYIFRDDRAGTRVRDALVDCARRGVRVRVLVDAVGSSRVPRRFFSPVEAAGGDFAAFNPVHLRPSRRLANFRSHRKIVVVDGTVGFTGGMNVCDDASPAARGKGAWRDLHVRFTGQAVHGLQRTFLENWYFAAHRQSGLPADELASCFPAGGGGSERVQVVASGPDGPSAIAAFALAAIGLARERFWIVTPYFVPDEPVEAALATAALRGVDVRVLVPARTDSRLVDFASRTYHDGLRRAGVRIALYGPPMIHAKAWVVDDALAVIGTANLDNRSLHLNFEVVAAFYGGAVVGRLADRFLGDFGRAREAPPGRSRPPLAGRLAESAARLLAPQL